MTVLISLTERLPLWYDARFPFDRPTIDKIKQVPGAKWEPNRKVWQLPRHAIPVLDALGLKYRVAMVCPRQQPALLPTYNNLRPYQQDAAYKLLTNEAFILAMAPRVGKTPTASVAAASQLASGIVRTVLVLYPNIVRTSWEQQFPKFSGGLPLFAIPGTGTFDFTPFWNMPYLVLGLHYEALQADSKHDDGGFTARKTVKNLFELLKQRGPYTVIADEPHLLRNRKSPRSKMFIDFGAGAAFRWALTGTPQRNYPRDLYVLFEFLQQGSVGSYTKFTTRYAGGHEGDYAWEADDTTNPEELNARLSSMWVMVSRADVAPWLPKLERSVILAQLDQKTREKYDKAEAALGLDALKAMESDDSGVKAAGSLRTLADMVSGSKMGMLLERLRFHVLDRRVKVVVFALYHETLNKAWDCITREQEAKTDKFDAPVFVAGGWLTREKREKEIERWKTTPGPAVLLVNSLSSGVGIDLADAEVAIGLETAWVPADFVQMESRFEDVHLGKRKSPALIEYLLAKNTIDEDMVMKLIDKLDAAGAVVGHDQHTQSATASLRGSGVVDRNVLSLGTVDPEVVAGALDSLRSRLMGALDDPDLYSSSDNNEVDGDDDEENDEDEDDE
jgi:hypothetical protein